MVNKIGISSKENELIYEKLELFEALKNNVGVNSILDIGYKYLNNPIVFSNLNFTLINSSGDIFKDNVWYKGTNGIYMHSEIVNELYNHHFPDEIINSQKSYIGLTNNSSTYLLFRAIRIDKAVIGFLCVVPQNHEHTELNIKYLDILGDTLSIELQKNSLFSENRLLKFNYLLVNLLQNNFDSEEDIIPRLKLLGWTTKKYYIVSLIYFNDFESYKQNQNDLTNHLNRIFPHCIFTYYQDSLVLLIGTNERKKYSDDIHLNTLLKCYNLKISFSHYFTNLKESYLYYQQVFEMKNIVNTNNNSNLIIYHLEDYIIEYLILSHCNKKQLLVAIHPNIKQLFDYDNINNTDYYKTVCEIIKSHFNYSRAAKYLHLHKTTLSYRLQKIEDIFGLTFDVDNDNPLNYLISIKLINLYY